MSLSTNAVNFGSAPVFSTQTAAVTIANTSIIPNQFNLSIVGSSVYSETDNCGSAVQPNTSCTVQVSFVPAAIGAQGATLKITSNVPEASGAVALSGLGIVAATTTTLTSNVDPSYPNQAVTFTATVSAPTGGLPSGTVTFRQGAKVLGATTLSRGQAVYGTSYSTIGTRIITASYAGDADFAASTASPLKQVVRSLPAATQTTVTSSADPSHLGNTVTFTATASSTYGAIPDGELITFYRGLTTLGSAPLTAGVATYSTSALTLGGHTIRAAYPGDATFKPSAGTIRQTVTR